MVQSIKAIKNYLDLISRSQSVGAENVSNSDVPNYLTKKVEMPKSFKDLMQPSHKLQMTITSNMHLQGLRHNPKAKILVDRDAKNFKPNGNNVDLTDQAHLMSENNMNYTIGSNLYKKMNSLLSMAVGK